MTLTGERGEEKAVAQCHKLIEIASFKLITALGITRDAFNGLLNAE